jgi:hypothetical protein
MTPVWLRGPIGQPCHGPLEEHGYQSLAPGIEADHSAGRTAVSVLLPVHRQGGVAGEVSAGELAECRVQEAGQLVGRGRRVLWSARWARRARQRWGSPRRPHVSGSGSNRSDTRMASGSSALTVAVSHSRRFRAACGRLRGRANRDIAAKAPPRSRTCFIPPITSSAQLCRQCACPCTDCPVLRTWGRWTDHPHRGISVRDCGTIAP